MIFKTKKYYKKKAENLDFQNYCLQITLQDTIEESEQLKSESEQLKSEIEQLKSEIEQLKSEKTVLHERKEIEVETYDYKPSKVDLYQKLKYKVIAEFDKNFEKYVNVSPIISIPREMKYKQFATILIERI